MYRVEMFAQLEDDVRQEEQTIETTPWGKAPFKKWNESLIGYEGRVRQMINVVFKEPIYKLFTRIRDNSYFKKTTIMGGNPRKLNQRWW